MANQVLYGFYSLQELANERVTPNNYRVISDAIDATVAEHNRQMNAINSLFVQKTTEYKVRYQTAQSARLQPLDSSGRARPIIPVGNYDLAFPIQMAGSAWGADYVARQKMTVAEVQRAVATMLDADMRWTRDHILAALYTNASWTFTDPQYGSLTVMPLANADSTKYMITSGSDAGATDTAFAAQASGIADATNPYPTIYNELMEHPENGGEVISFIPTNLVATTEALATYRAVGDPNVQVGANTARLIGTLNTPIPGTLRGYADKNWIVEWKSLPDNYIVSVTTGGEKPIAMREDPEASLQGFKKVAERNDHPFYEDQWLRRAGFGAWNRVGAFITRVGNGSYAIPTGYGSPMA